MKYLKMFWVWLKGLFQRKPKSETFTMEVKPPEERVKVKPKKHRSGHKLRSHHFGTFSPPPSL